MPMNTPVAFKPVGNTTEQLISKKGYAKQLVVDTVKNTVVVMDSVTYGGHPLAREAVKIKSASPNLKVNGGAEADLSGDITITVLPGYMATGFKFVENPEGQPEGKYLEITYSDGDGNSSIAYVDAALLVDTYTAGNGIIISGSNVISVDPTKLSAGAFAAENGGLEVTDDGKLKLQLGAGLSLVSGSLTIDGYPLVSQTRKVVAGTPNVKINGGDEAALASDIEIKVLPGTVPTGMSLVRDPASDKPGLWLKIDYMDDEGSPASYLVDMNALTDDYTAGTGITINDHVISVNESELPEYTAGPGILINDRVVSVNESELPEYTAGTGITINDHVVSVNESELPKWGDVVDGPLPDDYDASLLANGATVAFDCDAPEPDAVYLNNLYNTEEILAESGTYTAPVDGYYEVTCTQGGFGAFVQISANAIQSGNSGYVNTKLVFLKAGTIVPVAIGAAGIGQIYEDTTNAEIQRVGGHTYFGDYVNSIPVLTSTMQAPSRSSLSNIDSIAVYGGGNAPSAGTFDGYSYGSGGNALGKKANNTYHVGNGKQGCVRLRYYDPAKDTNISVDTATATTIADLQRQINELREAING